MTISSRITTKLCSDRAKTNVKAKSFFDIWRLFFDFFRLFFDLFQFRFRFRLVWVGP